MPLMMIGTPGRPGITISKPSAAGAVDGNPIRNAMSAKARMNGPGFPERKLAEHLRKRVKAGLPISGKPNAQHARSAQMLKARYRSVNGPGR